MIWLSTEYVHFMGICTFLNIELHGFSSTLNLQGNEEYGKSVFSHNFPVLFKFIFPIFWELYGFLLHPKYLRTHKFEMLVFSYTMVIHFFMFLELYGSLLHRKYLRKP